MSNVPIVKVDYGIASRYDKFIEVNRKLDYYPELKNNIIEHEKRHDSGSYTKNDFINDFRSKSQTFTECFKFCLINKESIINYFPLMYSYYARQWSFNTSSIIPFAWFGLFFTIFFHYTLNLSIFMLIIGWIVAMGIINFILIIYTGIYVKNADILRRKTKKTKEIKL
jgi:hypothetical protein